MTTLLFSSFQDPPELWLPALRAEMPDVEVRVDPEVGDPAEIDYALVYWPPKGLLASLPNLRAILSIAAGCDHILADPQLPAQLPIVRMVDDYLAAMMAEYAVYAVLHFHRDMDDYRAEQLQGVWNRRWPLYTPETDVGILGLGAIGADCAGKLLAMGFRVHGWSRSPKAIEGVICHAGEAGLLEMLGRCRYLVCVLPLTDETQGIVNARTLAAMPEGSYLINIARGGHVVDADLLAALDGGHIAGAFLDVFNDEPLPPEHPYWHHPKVWMTPHVAGELVPRSCAKAVAATIRRDQAGEPLLHLLDKERGY
ncbi:MAG: glyoxylate/hydroxypyruvate reductase A [Alphaproteobacteria bacterium]|nr:glyoxylate/hydroxypyruvate reductase A [Alphaproteobacteria bacterium]MDP6566085.1 glyoxylate/hydroxypyruvate reductase A [Alphaproteobacteria bacterium]MDP6812911.1 glyoxylate/hydroxypyruvate reductase A [Alphaproteobacteria bacterium]